MVRLATNLDMDALRTFVVGMDLGSFAKAADRLGRSPSAISLHLRKLETQVGQTLVTKKGRGLVATEAGETLLGYARRLLDLNDEASLALGRVAGLEGWIRIGVPPDFAETWLPTLLARFERAYPRVRVEVRADRGVAMVEAVWNGDLDWAVTWGRLDDAACEIIGERRMAWIASGSYVHDPGSPLPLAIMDLPCAFRQAAVTALDSAGISWRQSFATSSLSGVWAAVTAGLGITARTLDAMPPHLRVVNVSDAGLPPLDPVELAFHNSPMSISDAGDALKTLLLDAVERSQTYEGWDIRAEAAKRKSRVLENPA